MSLATLPRPLILTDDQFEAMARRGAFEGLGRIELREGVLTTMSPVYLRHAAGMDAITDAFKAALRASGLKLRTLNEITIRFGGGFQPIADLAIWDPAGVAEDYDGPLPGASVRLVVEVADASLGDDLGPKQIEYARAGLAEYWVADVKARMLIVHHGPGEGGYLQRDAVAFGSIISTRALPLTIDTHGL